MRNANIATILLLSLPICACAAECISLNGAGWTCDGEAVVVPHTWNAIDACDGPGDTAQTWSGYAGGNSVNGRGYVRKRAVYRRDLPAAKAGKRYFIRCEGVSVVSDVSVNGQLVGSHVGAFTAFAFEITDRLRKDGPSELEITADNRWNEATQPLAADYSVYGGIVRDVWLVETDPICIDRVTDGADGVRVMADAKTGEVRVDIAVLGGTNEVRRFKVEKPELWSPENPKLYTRRIVVEQQGSHDETEISFAFRTFEFRDGHFYLNGERRFLRGVNRHEDRAGKGWAVSAADEEEDIRLIKEMGADALRTAHYPQSRHIYDLCDRMGVICWVEFPNCNRLTFTDAFRANLRQQVTEMIRQNENHPCIANWSIFNELYNGEKWMLAREGEVNAMMAETRDLIHRLDPTRPVMGVMGETGRPSLNAIPDELGLNVYPKWYNERNMREMLDWVLAECGRKTVAITEYGVGASVKQHGDPAERVESFGMWHTEEFQAYLMHENLLTMMREPRLWGAYVWAMFDFGADNRREGDRHGINDKGLVTHDRKVKKDAYYMYQAAWTKTPVVRLVGTRMRSLKFKVQSSKVKGQTEDDNHHCLTSNLRPLTSSSITHHFSTVMGFSNQGPATLKVNGRVIGTREPDELATVIWPKVKLEPGDNRIELSAGGYTSVANWRVERGERVQEAKGRRDQEIEGERGKESKGGRDQESNSSNPSSLDPLNSSSVTHHSSLVTKQTLPPPIETVPHELDCLLEGGHIQGASCDESGVYLSHGRGIVKIGWDGRKIAEVQTPWHLGDCSVHKGRVYGAFKLPKPRDGMCGWIGVWDAATLKLLDEKPVETNGIGCVEVMGDRVYYGICGEKQAHYGADIGMADLSLRKIGERHVEFGYKINFGVQTMAADGTNLLCCSYRAKEEKGEKVQEIKGRRDQEIEGERVQEGNTSNPSSLNPLNSSSFTHHSSLITHHSKVKSAERHNCARLDKDLNVLETLRFGSSEGFARAPSSVFPNRAKPLWFRVGAMGGNIQGWRKDPTNNPPRVRLRFFEE